MTTTSKEEARTFLNGLAQHLGNNIDPSAVREFVRESKGSNYEFDFVNAFMLPSISGYLRQTLSSEDARNAFLAESTDAKKKGLTSATPAGSNRHLFTKVLGISANTLVDTWWGTGKEKPLVQSCPDWALFRSP